MSRYGIASGHIERPRTQQDILWPVFDDTMFDTDYYPARAKAQLASEIIARRQEHERFERQLRLTRKRARRARYLRWRPIVWSLVVLALLWLGLGGAQWMVGL